MDTPADYGSLHLQLGTVTLRESGKLWRNVCKWPTREVMNTPGGVES